jgi:FeS assembly SUF system protein
MELRDYILAAAKDDVLLSQLQNQQVSDEQRALIASAPDLHTQVIEVLKTVRDPEIPTNIWDLGLIYRLDVRSDTVQIDMTLTAAACPVAGAMPIEVEKRIRACLPHVHDVAVNLVWLPRWNKDMMSDEAKLNLDMW